MRVSAIHLIREKRTLFRVYSSSVAFGDTFPKSWGRLLVVRRLSSEPVSRTASPPLGWRSWHRQVTDEGVASICIFRFPSAVASIGRASTVLPVACSVRRFKKPFFAPPPTM